MLNIHIINDEKFVDALINNYKKVESSSNLFIVVVFNKLNTLKFVKQKDEVQVVYYKKVSQYLKKMKSKECSFFFHGVDRVKLNILENLNKKDNIVVHFWGADIYLLPRFRNKLYLDETKLIYHNSKSFRSRIIEFIRGYYFHFRYRKLFSKVNIYSTVLPNEDEFIKEYFPSGKRVNFNYVDIGSLGLLNFEACKLGNDILIGNSSSFTSNHIDTINTIEKIPEFISRKKTIPLNYGDANYAKLIADFVITRKLTNYMLIKEYLPIKNYTNILLNCSVAIMNHQRQQAVGNILICLWLGMKVFLSERNPAYSYFKNFGISIFSIENDIQSEKSLSKLSNDIVQNNRKLLKRLYSEEITIINVRHIIGLLNG